MVANNKEQHKSVSPGQRFIPLFLTLVWLTLITFAVIAALEPAWLKELSTVGRTDESRALKDLGDNFLRQKDYRSAIAQYQKAIDIKPDYVAAQGNMAIAYNQLGRGDQGIKILQDALVAGSNRQGTANLNIADILVGQGKKIEATGYLMKALGSEVQQHLVYRKLGILYYDTNNLDSARYAFDKALQLRTDPTAPYLDMLRLNRVLYSTEPEHVSVIESLLAAETDSDALMVYDLATIEQLSQNDPEVAKIYNHLGMIDLKQGDTLKAVAHFEQSQIIWRDNPDASNALRVLAKR